MADSFDEGQPITHEVGALKQNTALSSLLSNPTQLTGLLGTTPAQNKNIIRILTSAGAGAGAYGGMRLLEGTLGKRLAAALGGGIGGYLSVMMLEKIFKDEKLDG